MIEVKEGKVVNEGDVFVCIFQESLKICDIIGGLLCVVDLFEVCKFKEFVIFVEILGIIGFGKEIKGKKCFVIILVEGDVYEEMIFKWCQFNVFEGEKVEKGEVIVDGLEFLYDILCLCGILVVVNYIVN